MRELILVTCLAGLVAGCGAGVQDLFKPTGFHHSDYPYRVDYAEGTERQLLSADWRLDNFQMRDGELHDYKDADEYVYIAEFDTNDDGEEDADIELFQYDLLFEHRRHNGRIWLRTFPVSNHLADKSLEVLAENYVERVSGTGMMVSRLDDVLLEERRYGTRVVDSASGQVANTPAHRITFDVVNLDQQEADPDTVPTRVRLYLIRPPFTWSWGAGSTYRGTRKYGEWPLIMIAGYANDATRFEAEAADFEDFVSRLTILRTDGRPARGIEGFPPPAAGRTPPREMPEHDSPEVDEAPPAPDEGDAAPPGDETPAQAGEEAPADPGTQEPDTELTGAAE